MQNCIPGGIDANTVILIPFPSMTFAKYKLFVSTETMYFIVGIQAILTTSTKYILKTFFLVKYSYFALPIYFIVCLNLRSNFFTFPIILFKKLRVTLLDTMR